MEDMTGKVTKFRDGWQYRGRYPSGKQFRRIGFTTKREAADALNKLIAEVTSTGAEPGKGTVGEWLDEWLAIKSDSIKASTADIYDQKLLLIRPELEDIRLDKLDETAIRAAYRNVAGRYSQSTLNSVSACLRSALGTAVRERKIPRNPALNVPAPKGKDAGDRTTWTMPEVRQFLSYCDGEHDKTLWQFFLSTGMRRGEVCGLRWENVDLERAVVYVREQRTRKVGGKISNEDSLKTQSSRRTVPLDPGMVSALRAWRAGQAEQRLQSRNWLGGDYVFTSYIQRPYAPASFRDRLLSLCERAGVPALTTHELRHTFATLALEGGMEIKALSKMLGHKRIEITINLYVHPDMKHISSQAAKITGEMFG